MLFKHKNLIYLPVALIALVLCIRKVHEPDLWWQLRTGEYIVENKEVPNTDVFSFTYTGKPWLNVKWGFEVGQAAIVKWLGPEYLPLPQFFANVLMLAFLVLIMRNLEAKNQRSTALKSAALLLFLLGMSYRMNGRPELVSYTFTALYLFVFTQFWCGKQKWIFALLPAQMLWANLHEGYGTGMVISAIFIITLWIEFHLDGKTTSSARNTLLKQTAIVVASWLVVAAHPGGLQMIWHPYEIFTQLTKNQFTQEIYSAAKKAYWQMPAFIGLALGAIAAYHTWQNGIEKGRFSFNKLRKTYPLFYIIVFAAFFYLSLKSYRNLPFLLVVSTPLVAMQLHIWLGKISKKKMTWVLVTTAFLFYMSITTNVFYHLFLPAEEYGWGVSTTKNPVGAAQFIEENKLEGPAFSDYLSSSYFLWRLQPDFKTFVDLRDLDVFEAEDMEIALVCCNAPTRRIADGRTIWDVVNERFRFNYVVVLNQPEFLPLHRYLQSGTHFKLAYADALTSVFIRNSEKNTALISAIPADVFRPTPKQEPRILAKIAWPFYEPQNQTSTQFNYARAAYYQAIGQPFP